MNTIGKLTLVALLLLGVAAAGYWFGAHPASTTKVAADFHQSGAQGTLLPQSDGFARYLPGSEEGFDGHGIRAGV